MPYVMDCSWSSALFLPDENSGKVESFFLHQKKQTISIHVPPLWWNETTNVLLSAMKRNRLSPAAALEILQMLDQLSPSTDQEYGKEIAERALGLGREHGLSGYDAAYLELAMRKQATLLTLDNALAKTAKAIGLAVE